MKLEDGSVVAECALCSKPTPAHTTCFVCNKEICKKHGKNVQRKGKRRGKEMMISLGYICSECDKKKAKKKTEEQTKGVCNIMHLGETWSWVAIYGDGTESLPQYNEDGTENLYTDIDRDRLSSFAVFYEKKLIAHVHIGKNKKLFARRKPLMQGLLSPKKVDECFLVGWQERINGTNVQTICVCFRDGHIELLPEFNDKIPWAETFKHFRPEEILPGQIGIGDIIEPDPEES